MAGISTAFWKRSAALLLALCMLAGALPALASSVMTTVQVRSAPLNNDSAPTNGMVRVYLASLGSPTELNLTLSGSYLLGATGETLYGGSSVRVQFNAATGSITLTVGGQTRNFGQSVSIRRTSAGSGQGIKIREARESGNLYPGDLSLKAVAGDNGFQLYPIVHVYIEDYLYGVVPYEMGNSSNVEALKAQAVAARTYTVRMMKSRASGLYDVKDTTSDQVYRGTPAGNANCVAAVDATKGVVLMYGSSYITTFYSSSNGGQTETSRTGTSYPYMPVKDDPFDYANSASTVKKKSIFFNLQSGSNPPELLSLLKSKVIARLNQLGYAATQGNTSLGWLQNVTPHSPKYASPSRLYTKMDFTMTVTTGGVTTTQTITCDIFNELESLLSLGIQSTQNELWTVAAKTDSFEIQVRRYGHGMGMSQRGAMYMAKLGYTYDQILGFYYEGCTRVRHSFTHTILTPSGNEEVTVVPPAEEDEESSLSCYGTVQLASAGTSLALRSAASSNAAVIGSAANGARVEVLAQSGNWYLIRFGEIRGYVPTSSVSVIGTPVGNDSGATPILGFATVTATDFVNLRASQSTSSKVLGTAPAGAVLTVFSQDGGWARVQHNALAAYVSTAYISAISSVYPSNDLSSGGSTAVVNTPDGGYLNVRASASTSSQVLTSLPFGTEVTVLSDDGSWSRISWMGTTGYVVSRYLKAENELPETQQPEQLPSGSLRAVVTTQSGGLNMRALAQAGSQILMTIPRYAQVDVTGRGPVWSAVRFNGLNGYVMTQFLTFEGEDDNVPDAPVNATSAVVVTPAGTLNMREQPQTGSWILCQIAPGETVQVEEYGPAWCKIVYRGMDGYVMTQFLSFEEQKPTTPEQENLLARVQTAGGALNLRAQPGTYAAVIGMIPQHAQVQVIQRGSPWSEVLWQGTSGYVMTSYLSFDVQEPVEPETQPIQPSSQIAYVSTPSGALNFRGGAGMNAELLGVIPRGESVQVLSIQGEWCRILWDEVTGYVMTKYLNFDGPPVLEPEQEQNTAAWVNTTEGALNLRSQPDASSQVLFSIPQYASVTCHSQSGSWTCITYQGIRGYVMSKYLSAGKAPQETTETLVHNGLDITMAAPAAATYAVAYHDQGLALHTACNGESEIIAFVPAQMQVEVILQGSVWCLVEYQGAQGYCRTELLNVR